MSDKSQNAEHILAGLGKQMVEASPSGMILVDAQSDDMPIVYVNAAFQQLTGYSRDEAIGRNCRFMQGDDRYQPDLDILRNAIQKREACTVTLRNYRKDGTLFWNELHISPLFSTDGQLIHFVGVQHDVTEREEALDQIRTTSANLRAMLDGSQQSFTLLDRERRVVDADEQSKRSAERIFGKRLEAGASIYDFVLPRDHESFTQNFQRALRGEIVKLEKSFPTADGDPLYFEIVYYPVTDDDGVVIGVCMSHQDITERKQMEDQLRQQRDELDRFFTVTLDLLCIAEMDGTFIRANNAWETTLGYPVEELIGRTVLDFLHPDDVQPTQDALAQLSRQEQVIGFTHRIRTPDGDYRVIEWHSNPYGNLLYAAGRDITERKQMEERLRKSEANMRSMLNSTMSSFTLIDREGRIVDADEKGKLAAQRIFGKKMQPSDDIYDYVLSRDHESFRHNFQRALTGEVIVLEKEFPTSDGKPLYFEVIYYPVTDSNEDTIGVCMSSQDITERKRMEEALRRSEKEFRALVENIPDTVQRLTREGVHLYVNPLFAQQMGMTQADIIGKSNEELGLPTDLIKRLDAFRETACTSKQAVDLDFNFTVADETRYLSTRLVPELDEQGNVVSLLGITRDITERKQMEEALRRSQHFIEQINYTIPDLIYVFDLTTNSNIYANRHTGEMLGYTPEAIQQMGDNFIPSHIHPDDLARVLARVADEVNLLSDGEISVDEYRMRHADGSYRWLYSREVIFTRQPDGKPAQVLGVAQDITARKAAEEALRQSEERLRVIVDNVPVMLGILSTNGRFEFVNQHWVDKLGWTAQDLAQLDDPWTAFYPDPDYRQEVMDLISESDDIWQENQTHTRQNGIINTRWANIRLSDGRIIGIGQDVTELRHAQEHEFQIKLERERRRLLTSFIEGAAHEFRTPLATINSSAYLMSRSDDLERRAQKAEQVEMQVKRITRLVDSLLLMTRLESNEALASNQIDPGEILRAVCTRAKESRAKNHQLDYAIAPDLPSIMGDQDHLSEAFQQIIDNACRFTPEGGKISVIAENADDHIWIEIRDSGPGIAEDDLSHIFETFWRQDSAHSTPGFGLGLPIAQKIIERHGGEITVESKVGQGTIVHINLPV